MSGEYQMRKTIGKCFRSSTDNFNGVVRIYGSPYMYRVINGIPEKGAMLEVVDFSSTELFVTVNNYLFESDVNYIDNP
ncbi:hypothetical protein JZO66_01370 [Enterococcus sp. DIV0242_7C1]|uniref:Uncharacterized protein n=1 Tax=Candidatus Enterococcus dunnyi TaxID=1834192 RepID=A0A200JED0_9ENTE|nr:MULTISPECIES: hypothetical protein [unclassified Enterococcus]MBO0469177.1 hypothetical protein [Enterococcus sp. DIV0242_7C1]MCA5012761.1 hypothetical protein [Enterococcus sp. S23]MCA5016012.1 hypothetical protein [Enterococcus sp. S22(2020)]OUZ35528.1 hypothetical protein A5889_001004 [Enterococcus sp. 9D6_DIV0238]